jgi:hypothetical protein
MTGGPFPLLSRGWSLLRGHDLCLLALRGRRFALALSVFVSMGIAPVTTLAQSLPLVSTLGSASALVPQGQSSVPITTTPMTGHFILTQGCTNSSTQAQLVGGLGGFIATFPQVMEFGYQTGSGFAATFNRGQCITFAPGFLLPARDKVICQATGGGSCSVTWVIEKQ